MPGDRSEIQLRNPARKRHEVDANPRHNPAIGNVSGPEVHLREIESDAAAYLRVAHIYMLISMPTDTSAIFGAFQAIWLSFWYRTCSVLRR